MTTSSARPDQLNGFAIDLRSRGDGARSDVDALTRSMARYRAGCGPATPVDGIDWITRNRLDRARALATSVSQIAQVFIDADRSSAPVATADSVALCDMISDRLPALATGALLDPRRSRVEHARGTGESLRTLTEAENWPEIERLLAKLSPALVADPSFAAAVLNGMDAQTIVHLVDLLVRSGGVLTSEPGQGLTQLSRLHNAATHTSAGPGPSGLDPVLLGELGSTGSGRNALRILLTTSPTPPAPEALADVLAPLLLDHDAESDAVPAATSIEVGGTGPGADGDAALLAVVATMPDVAVALIEHPLGGHPPSDRFSQLYRTADAKAQDALAAVLDAALQHPELRGPDHEFARAQVMNDVTTALSGTPTAVGPPMASVLAGSVFEDTDYWATRARRGTADSKDQVTTMFEAISRHDRSFVTVATGLEVRQRSHMADVVAGRTDDLEPLDDLDALSKRLEEGAERADRPGDPWGWAFTAADRGLDIAQVAIPGGPTAKSLLRPAVDAGLEHAHQHTRPDPGHRENEVERQRVRRRANAWAAIAEDSVTGPQLVAAAGDTSVDLDRLRHLGTDPDGLSELAIWERAQPEKLQALADRLAGPA